MAIASSQHITSSKLTAVQGRKQSSKRVLAPPGLLRCLVVSWCEERAELFRVAAEAEAWQAVVCCDVGQFVRNMFRLKVPVTIVDLPPNGTAHFEEFREAAVRSRTISNSLLVVSTAKSNAVDELWARQLGVWAHLPEASDSAGLKMMFREARQALTKQAMRSEDKGQVRNEKSNLCEGPFR